MQQWNLDASIPDLSLAGWSPPELQPRELALFSFLDFTSLARCKNAVEQVRARTNKVVYSTTAQTARQPDFQQFLRDLPPFAVSVRLSLPAEGPTDYQGRAGVVTFENSTTREFLELRKRLSPCLVIPEIQLQPSLLELGPTLMHLATLTDIPWFTLRPYGEPDALGVAELSKCFEYLELRNFPEKEIYFSFDLPSWKRWQMQSYSPFAGLREVHIDLTNRCTHSCVFCGLYGNPDPERGPRTISPETRAFMAQELPVEKALTIIESLPETVERIQFGGAGDPMLHRNVLEILRAARSRGFLVETLSNLEYLREEDLAELTAMGGFDPFSLHIVVNLSSATPETYVKTRPKQTAGTFEKVLRTLRQLKALREASGGRGVNFTLMCVVQKHNFHEAKQYVELARTLGAFRVWLKPMELHSPEQKVLYPTEEQMPEYRRQLRAAVDYAEANNVYLFDADDIRTL